MFSFFLQIGTRTWLVIKVISIRQFKSMFSFSCLYIHKSIVINIEIRPWCMLNIVKALISSRVNQIGRESALTVVVVSISLKHKSVRVVRCSAYRWIIDSTPSIPPRTVVVFCSWYITSDCLYERDWCGGSRYIATCTWI
jgi:hypothetical protein